MCCRFAYYSRIIDDIEDAADWIDPAVKSFHAGDIHPSESAVILKADPEHKICAGVMPWGFLSYDKKLLINARAESVQEKRTFADSMRYRRCVIPAGHFYEWDRNKVRNTFFLPENRTFYMAGIYNVFDQTDRFTVLTAAANGSMSPVHDRMPLIIPDARIRDWILDYGSAGELLAETPPEFLRKADYEQLSLF